MKQALLVATVILAIHADGQQSSNSGLEMDPRMHQKNGTVHNPEADAKEVIEEHKASANVVRICDTFLPPACLLLILWFALTLQRSEEGKKP